MKARTLIIAAAKWPSMDGKNTFFNQEAAKCAATDLRRDSKSRR